MFKHKLSLQHDPDVGSVLERGLKMKIIKVKEINMGRRNIKKVRDMSWMLKISLVLVFTFILSICMHGGFFKPKEAQAVGGYITSCSGCHQYTTTFADGTARNTPAGQFLGTHNAHVQTYGYTCAVCHTIPVDETSASFKHRDNNIQMASAGANYLTGTSWPQTNAPSLTTCGVTVCHGTNSGTWGTNASARDACTVCHGILTTNTDGATTAVNRAPGAQTTGLNTAGAAGTTASNVSNDSMAGAHDVHLRALNTYSTAITCDQCHAEPAVSVAGIKGHLDGLPANMTWGARATNSGAVTPTYNFGGGTCTNYCHGVNLADGSPTTKQTPDWNTNLLNGTGGADCGRCHGNPPNTGDHGGVTANVCTPCHPHVVNSATTTPFFQTSGAYSLASHINGVKDAAGGTCLGCHASRQPSSGDQRTIIIGGAAGSEGGDFVRTSRHVKNTTVKNLDCVICHAEGDVTSTETAVVRHSTLHANQTVDLRNVDSYTNSWAWPGYRLVAKTITSTNRDNMDTFCMNCHDSDASSATASQGGAYSIAVNGTSTAILTGAAVSRRTTPFNHLDGGTPLDARGQFNRTNLVGKAYASHHQLNQFTPRYTAAYQTTYGTRGGWTGTSKDGVAYQWATKMHCSDCHLNEANAHGSINTPRMLQAKNGTDSTWTDADGTGTFVCYKCHLSTIYSGGSGDATVARLSHGDLDAKPWGTGYAADARQIRCLNCHGGAGIGQIHGNNRSITTRSAGTTSSYRFMFGAELGYNIAEANWVNTTQPACYTSSTTWGGSCTSHDSGTSTGRIGAPRYSRALE